MNWLDVYYGIAIASGGFALLAVVFKFGGRLFRNLSKMGEFLKDWNGEPARPGWPARPGIMTRLSQQDCVLDKQNKVLDSLQRDVKELKERLPKQ